MPELDACRLGLATAEDPYAGALCFYEFAARTGDWEGSREALIAAEAERPDDPWLPLVRAHVTWSLDASAAEALYRDRARAFGELELGRGELMARTNLRNLLVRAGRTVEADSQVERVRVLGALSADGETRLRARVTVARHASETGRAVAEAYGSLQAEDRSEATASSWWLRKEALAVLGNLAALLGRYDEALAHFAALAGQAAAAGDAGGVALGRFNRVNARLEAADEAGMPFEPQALRARARSALDAARVAERDDLAMLVHRLLGELHGEAEPRAAMEHLEHCEALARALERPGDLAECQALRARALAGRDPEAARSLVRRAVRTLEDLDDLPGLAHAWRQQMHVAWHTESFDDALAASRVALGVIDSLRELQATETGRRELQSAWTRDYYWLSGELLRRAAAAGTEAEQRASRAEAFAVLERLRARSLLERLRAPDAGAEGISESEEAAEAARERATVLRQIVHANRALLRGGDPAERAAFLGRLEQLEHRERALRPGSGVSTFEPASLAAVQDALGPDEALIAFQLGLDGDARGSFAGGGWVLTVTRTAVRAEPVPDRHAAASRIASFRGLIGAGSAAPRPAPGADPVLAAGARALRDRWLAPALAGLPPTVTRLILVPDGALHELPFALLPHGDDGYLAERFELQLVPSAGTWLHWRQQTRPSAPLRPRALVFADPAPLDGSGGPAAIWRSASLAAGVRLGALPQARREGRAVVRRLEPGSRLLLGDDASEAAMKGSTLEDFGVLHFASHAVVDGRRPERSAVVLAPGGEAEDGLLQAREIAALSLHGQLVVLSACQSATGGYLRGEGVLGLARSFFAAGAGGVVGSLWPVRDDHARAFFEPFYRSLAEGAPVSAAVRRAQRELAARGVPPEGWAGFTALGPTVSLAPVASGPGPGIGRLARALVGLTGLVVLALMLARRVAGRLRGKPTPTPASPPFRRRLTP